MGRTHKAMRPERKEPPMSKKPKSFTGSNAPTCSASSFWWPLWKHLRNEHGLILVESECDAIAAAVDESRKAAVSGYTCRTCEEQRPRTWYVYEIERNGGWLTPCCAICARKGKSRGPFRQNADVTAPGSAVPDSETTKPADR
jgi:hypothetical protein